MTVPLLPPSIGQYDAWTLDQFDAAAVQAINSAPSETRNRAPATVNLAHRSGIDSIVAVRYKGGDAPVTDGPFATAESRQALADLGPARDFQTVPTAGDDVNPNDGCSKHNSSLESRLQAWLGRPHHHSRPTRYLSARGRLLRRGAA